MSHINHLQNLGKAIFVTNSIFHKVVYSMTRGWINGLL